MAKKPTSIWQCVNCGAEYNKERFGRCDACNQFSTYSEVENSSTTVSVAQAGLKSGVGITPTKPAEKLSDLKNTPMEKFATGIGELDRVLGGGFVPGEVVLFAASPGSGKALEENTIIPLYDGSFKKIKDIIVGDILIDMNGLSTTVQAKFHPSIKNAYRIKFDDGTIVDACEDHIWNVYDHKERRGKNKSFDNKKKILNKTSSENIMRFLEGLHNLKNANPLTINISSFIDFLNKYPNIFTKNMKYSVNSRIHNFPTDNKNIVLSGIIDEYSEKIKYEFGIDRYFDLELKELTTKELFDGGIKSNLDNRRSWSIPNVSPIKYDQKDIAVSPYTLGLWLGDGNSNDARITALSDDMIEYSNITKNVDKGKIVQDSKKTHISRVTLNNGDTTFISFLKKNNLLRNKHIPEFIFTSSISQRKEVLQGLMDTDGTLKKGTSNCEIGFSSLQLITDVQRLLSTLGMKSVIKEKQPMKNGKPFGNIHYRIAFTSNFNCFKLSRKVNKFVDKSISKISHTDKRYIDSIEKIDSVETEYYCLMVDSKTHTFLCSEKYIPTHNSTLSLSIAEKFAQAGKTVLYSSGEESTHQIGLRAKRMEIDNENISVISETNLESLIGYIESVKPNLLIVDSLQTLASSELTGSIGSVAQSKEAANVLTRIAKNTNTIMLLINQVVKDDSLAGSNQTTHIVDCVIMLDSDSDTPLKFLRATKNRFGDTSEVGIFQHNEKGLAEVSDPGGILLDENDIPLPGTAVCFMSEGIRQVPVEVQALVVPSNLPNPKKNFAGVDYKRGQIVCGILDKFCRAKLFDNDVFVNTVSGIKIIDPMADLAIAASIISSVNEKTFAKKTAFIGELSLTGQVRGSFMIDNKIREAERLGFETVVIPSVAKKNIFAKHSINIEYISSIRELTSLLRG